MKQYPAVQLATLVDQVPAGGEWIHEIKFDGYRLLSYVSGNDARLQTRNGKDWTRKFPSIVAALEALTVSDAVLDMEAVVMDEAGKSSFQALQAALGDGGNGDTIVGYAFDLLHLNGERLIHQPLTARKAQLAKLLRGFRKNAALRFSEHVNGNGAAMMRSACRLGLEGVISKLAESTYTPGRSKSWLKSKCSLRQEFLILGYSDARRGRRAMGALYLGYNKDDTLKYAGKVGTGFSLDSARALVRRLTTRGAAEPVLNRAAMPDVPAGEYQAVHWVRPELICEVSFTEWTQDGRVRHPSFEGLREDKEAGDVKMEKPAAASGLVLQGITITHPDRVISETGHVTKGDLAEYFDAVAPFMLPRISKHPLSLLRCPNGIDSQCFYQRNPGKGLGDDVHPFDFRHKGKKYEYLYIDSKKGLLSLIQMGSVEIHPWGSSIDAIDYPEWMIFDLDPAADVPFEAVKLGAQDLRQRLKDKGLGSSLKCTGGKGLHVTVMLSGKDKWPEVKAFAASIAKEMVDSAPEAYVATMTKAKRTGKIFIDFFRNDYTATAIADFGVRARPGAPVAVPLEWSELKSLKSPSQFTMKDVLNRLKRKKPPVPGKKHVLPR